MQSHRCWCEKTRIYTYIHTFLHKLYVHTLRGLGLDLATKLRKKVLFFFLINKACHVRWPCVTRVWQQLLFISSHSAGLRFPKLNSCFADVLWNCLFVVFTLHVTTSSESLIYWILFLRDPARPTSLELPAVMSSLGDRSRCQAGTFGTALHRSSKAWHHFDMRRIKSAGRSHLGDVTTAHCDVIPHAPTAGSLVRQRLRHRVRYLTVVAPGWRLVRLAASALWLCRAIGEKTCEGFHGHDDT